MKSIAIIGAGQLGSRHLQAIALCGLGLSIFVVDPVEESLNISEKRFLEVDNYHNKQLFFVRSVKELPSVLDFVVIATSSKQRLSVLKELLQNSKVSYLLLEKFLFPIIEEYKEALNLIEEKQVKVYVNCARRMWTSYQDFKNKLIPNSKIQLKVTGSNWNLASNAIHFLDLFFYLTNDETMIIDTSKLDNELIKNKRKGYIELSGTLTGHTKSGNYFSLTSIVSDSVTSEVIIESGKQRYIIKEGLQEIQTNNISEKFVMFHQSELTHIVFEQLLETGECSLVPFERSIQDHLLLLKAFNKVLNGREGAIT
ncbi:Gfo/Idh/MocA family oxidoreductase [Psychrobacillus psychrotolerans]|uniref:Gfo/Idh/MocA family oxidoreductase n=1 Tax=Psychrobacillus psychrotolerans TaxID=126156 RepID=UPI003C77AAEB